MGESVASLASINQSDIWKYIPTRIQQVLDDYRGVLVEIRESFGLKRKV